jgi:membrane protein YqaA with SNARE-associated domain
MLSSGRVSDSALVLASASAVKTGKRLIYRALGFLGRPIAPKSWNALLYCCGGAATVCLLSYALFPAASELVVFLSLMFFTSAPCSTFVPAASEPILMVFGKLHPPLLLASVGIGGIALAEWVNYRVFGAVLDAPRLRSLRDARLMRRATTSFNVLPFWTTAFCAFTPFPFWIVRTCAVVARYPFERFALATVLGRFPRIFLIALLGSALPITGPQIALGGGALVAILASLAVRSTRRVALSGGLQ